ncbi:MAG TPA: transglycosylase domain-containing protein [Polyangiales bacterium]|nr:transglycosylase domain-containing protein [Polyangiales bacterium]
MPQLVKGRVESAVQDRTGLSVSIDRLGLGFSGVTLSQVQLRSADGKGVALDVDEADVELSLVSAVFQGAGAVTGASVRGLDGEVDVASPDFDELRKRLGSRSQSSEPSAGKPRRELRLERFHVSVKRGSDEILAAEGGEIVAGQDELNASLSHVRLTQPQLAVADARDVDVVFTRGGGLRLRKAHVADALVSITPDGLRRVRGARPREDDAPDDDAEPAAQPKAPEASHSRQESLQAVLAKLAPGAEVVLGRATFEQVEGTTRTPVLRDVECKLSLESDDALRIVGRGDADGGGRLDTDMRIWPKDLRADVKLTLSSLPLKLLVPLLPSVPWFEPQQSRIDAALTIRAESPARVSLEGKAALRNMGLSSERLAVTPVRGINASIEGRGHWLPIARRLEIDSGSFGLGKAVAQVKGAVELDAEHFAFDIDAVLPQTPCTDAVRAIPKDLLGDMSLAQWQGTIGGRFRFQTDSRDLDKTVLDVDVKDRCDFQVVPVVADLSRFSSPFTHTVEEPDGKVFEMETGPGTPAWTPIEAMSPYFVHAVLVHEDPQFFSHHGFSMINVRNAVVRDLRERRYAVGASTITMQLVKNVFLHREKTLARKIQEVLLTWWTERVMEKRDILELYFNVIEYGPSVYGIRAAAQHYWNRLPSELSPAESVFLATILPNPKKYHSYYDKNALSNSWMSQMRSMMKRMGERGAYDAKAVEYGMQEIDHFKFARDGAPAAPRVIPGSTAVLPYMQVVDTGADVD